MDRESEGPFEEGAGVSTIEGRDFKGGGPIMEPSNPARITDLLVDKLPDGGRDAGIAMKIEESRWMAGYQRCPFKHLS